MEWAQIVSGKGIQHMRHITGFVYLLAVCLLSTASLFAQTTGLSGTVMDPSGAVIPNANVTVTNTQTGAQRTAASDDQGRYSVPQLQPGSYQVKATASGFAELVIARVDLLVNEPRVLPL